MKLFFYSILIIVTANFSNCKKQSKRPVVSTENKTSGFTENKTVAVNTCSSFTQNAVNYSICLDSVANDSRCPQGVECIWMGYAKAKFSFTAGSLTHHFALHTLVQSGAGSFPNDTTIDGIKIRLVNLTPYPDIAAPTNYNDYKADVEITQQ